MKYRISIAQSDVSFECAPDQSLLDAALAAGIDLPYSCRQGVCGNCAGSIEAGTVTALAGANRNDTCSADQVLYCRSAPLSDLVLKPQSWQRIDPSARKRFKAKVYSNQLVAADVSLLRLRLPTGQRAKFQAGQYLQLLLDDGSTRSYSMANAPHESDGVSLHIRHLPGGLFSQRVAQLVPGDILDIELPFGSVALRDDDPRPLVFVAAGTGFAPVKAILDDMLKRGISRPLTLIWGARQAEGLYLPSAVERWQKHWPDFRYIAALSDTAQECLGSAFAGRVDAALRSHCPDLHGHALYCCGAPPMVDAVRRAAAEIGLAASDFHADVFVPGPAAGPVAALATAR